MPLAETILGKDPCVLAARWLIDVRLATLLDLWLRASIISFPRTPQGDYFRGMATYATIISGHRTQEQQERLSEQGRPAAPDDVSTHRSCPATGADIRVTGTQDEIRRWWELAGPVAEAGGLRWGGGSPRVNGFPSDFNHLDLGPRRS